MTADYFRERAADARREANATDLANVRDRCLRSERTFLDMATRAERAARMRARVEAEKAAKVDAEALPGFAPSPEETEKRIDDVYESAQSGTAQD